VRLVSVDEAGISNKAQEPVLVVAAVIVDADKQFVALERQIDNIVARHIPQEHQAGFVFHASQLFNGGGKIFTRDNAAWPLEKRLAIADELAAIPARFHLPLTMTFVPRAEFPSRRNIERSTRMLKRRWLLTLLHLSPVQFRWNNG